ncbi:hypothetical protein FPZ12_011340 [Amycolatopsis acidicola]|uniref:Uncharacterized protein n=1 Tax=Amycolatopsis acidicola TaxID=2596893 RepID=A0A5N0VBX6_9PSEU|nr:hypothetical protein [Amycolatopsis acidicola]KAA9162640.1 hypothetical protein FPZ12_011340 [Amycolatopsis acidicola]
MPSAAPMPDAVGAASYLVVMTALPVLCTYLLTRRDFRPRGTALATAGCAILMGAGSWLGFVFPLLVFVVAAVVYLVARRLIRPGPALAWSAVTLVGGILCSVLAMKIAIDSMG